MASHPLGWTLANLEVNVRMDVERTETCALLMKMQNGSATMKISRDVIRGRGWMQIHHWIQHSSLGYTPKRIQSHGLKQAFVHQCSYWQCSQQVKVRTTQAPSEDVQTDNCDRHRQWNVARPWGGGNSSTCSNLNEHRTHCTKWNEPDTGKYTSYDFSSAKHVA